jgi:hypothetical protein
LIAAFPSGFLSLAYCLAMLHEVFAIITGNPATAKPQKDLMTLEGMSVPLSQC